MSRKYSNRRIWSKNIGSSLSESLHLARTSGIYLGEDRLWAVARVLNRLPLVLSTFIIDQINIITVQPVCLSLNKHKDTHIDVVSVKRMFMGMGGLALTSKIRDSYKAWSNAYFGWRLGSAPGNVIIRLLWLAAILRSFHHVTGTVKVTTSSCFRNVTTGYINNH